MAKIQDTCPAFARHVFAISAVSGGSLGASLFSSLVKVMPAAKATGGETADCQPELTTNGPLQKAARQFMAEDFLTPLLAAGLFPDFLQQFLPVAIPAFDRSRALERTYEMAWQNVARSAGADATDVFGGEFRAHWSAAGEPPALLLNVTRTWTGGRVVIAPFQLGPRTPFNDDLVDLLNTAPPVRLSTATGISARYPFITPPALFVNPNPRVAIKARETQFVDGGYLENTGLQTVVDLIQAIREAGTAAGKGAAGDTSPDCASANTALVALSAAETRAVCFKILVLRAESSLPDHEVMHEISAVLRTAYRVRTAKTRQLLGAVNDTYCGGKFCGVGLLAETPHVRVKYLHDRQWPLGWYLSRQTLDKIAEEDAPVSGCLQSTNPSGPVLEVVLSRQENACFYPRIRDDLTRRGAP